MDRRQRKTREAIFSAFIDLLAEKNYSQITVGEILARADIARATFYAHFETKDYLLKALCEDLFCHIFDGTQAHPPEHRHLFQCDPPDSAFLHLFQHLMRDDNHVLKLLSGRNNELFLGYFKELLQTMAASQLTLFAGRKHDALPEDFWVRHIAATFVETLRWWLDKGMEESPETFCQYFSWAV